MFKSPNDLFVSYFAAKNISVFTYVFSYEGERAPTFFGKQGTY